MDAGITTGDEGHADAAKGESAIAEDRLGKVVGIRPWQ